MSLAWTCIGCFAATFVSAIVPWVNAEIMVLALPALASSSSALALLVVIATAGQMTGKLAVYWAGRGSAACPSPRVARMIARWEPLCAASPGRAAGLVALSSAVGIPPFFVMTLVAGALRMDVARFLAAGTCGRLIRFGTLVLVPHVLAGRPWA